MTVVGGVVSNQILASTTSNTLSCTDAQLDTHNQVCLAFPFFSTNEYYTATIPTVLVKELANVSNGRICIQASSSGTTCFVELKVSKITGGYSFTASNSQKINSGNRYIVLY